MSGLRETIRRRGGLELTSRVVGGLWVVGERTQTSPYNAAATAALMAAFPTQWPTIRDYGWQHEEIVGYMNAYAPEDAKIAYSLVEGIGTRWCYNDNSGNAYIDLGFKADLSLDIEVTLKIPVANSNVTIASFGTWNTQLPAITYFCKLTGGSLRYVRFGYSEFTNINSPVAALNVKHICRENKDGIWLDGNKYASLNVTQNFTTPLNMALYRTMGAGNAYYNSATYIAKATIGGNNPRYMIPFKRNGAMGMIDLLTGTFYGNANSSGSFSESIDSPS